MSRLAAGPRAGRLGRRCAQPPNARWVIDLDFCIHPSRAGYTQMMEEVVNFARAHPQDLGFASSAWVS
jgi:hypothetical protein